MGWRLPVAVVAMVVACACLSACEPGQPSGGTDLEASMAKYIKDGESKYYPAQGKCIVCESPRLNGKYYVEEDGKRIYFDKQACVDKFKANRSKYLQEFRIYAGMEESPEAKERRERRREQMPEGMPLREEDQPQ